MTTPSEFEALWETLEPQLVPKWDMTDRLFYLQHPDYPTLHISAPSDALALRRYYEALQQHLYNM
jgi:hypothetical protein